jgi:diaminopimelate epimerase
MIPFRKYHGLGNDFVVLEGIVRPLPLERLTDPATAAAICARHTGVGADGLLLVLPPLTGAALARMRVINADGSEPEMCGNGIRCVAKALHDHVEGFGATGRIVIDTGAGALPCDLTLGHDGRVESVRVDMGQPSLERKDLPMTGTGRCVESPLEGVDALRWTAVSMGNPHIVTFVEDPAEDLERLARTLGPQLEHDPAFPNRTNVEFVWLDDSRAEAWIWERGCGITQACGTGACAVGVAAVASERHQAGAVLPVHLPGGTLSIEVEPELQRVWMDGPAVEVFEGELDLDAF